MLLTTRLIVLPLACAQNQNLITMRTNFRIYNLYCSSFSFHASYEENRSSIYPSKQNLRDVFSNSYPQCILTHPMEKEGTERSNNCRRISSAVKAVELHLGFKMALWSPCCVAHLTHSLLINVTKTVDIHLSLDRQMRKQAFFSDKSNFMVLIS